jgi:hypothetical protein
MEESFFRRRQEVLRDFRGGRHIYLSALSQLIITHSFEGLTSKED